MGWWKIKNIESGSIDFSRDNELVNTFSRIVKLVNAFPENTTNESVIGDGPADTMGDAIKIIRKQYKEYWDRDPTKDELQAVLNFVINPLGLKNRQIKNE